MATLVSTRNPSPTPTRWVAHGATPKIESDNIAQADKVSIEFIEPGADDALLVAGMALAKGVKTELVAPQRKKLPWFLRNAELSYPGQVTVVELDPKKPADKAPPDPSVYQPQQHDTFIGCLMSGLDKQQYAEGRSHLMAIHETLQKTSDSQDNYCEGINIGSNQSFGKPKEALVIDIEAIRGSKQCVFYQYDDESRPSGMWVELGAALAMDKPCTLLTPNLDGVPPAVRKGMKNLTVVVYENHDKFQQILKDSPEKLLPS